MISVLVNSLLWINNWVIKIFFSLLLFIIIIFFFDKKYLLIFFILFDYYLYSFLGLFLIGLRRVSAATGLLFYFYYI